MKSWHWIAAIENCEDSIRRISSANSWCRCRCMQTRVWKNNCSVASIFVISIQQFPLFEHYVFHLILYLCASTLHCVELRWCRWAASCHLLSVVTFDFLSPFLFCVFRGFASLRVLAFFHDCHYLNSKEQFGTLVSPLHVLWYRPKHSFLLFACYAVDGADRMQKFGFYWRCYSQFKWRYSKEVAPQSRNSGYLFIELNGLYSPCAAYGVQLLPSPYQKEASSFLVFFSYSSVFFFVRAPCHASFFSPFLRLHNSFWCFYIQFSLAGYFVLLRGFVKSSSCILFCELLSYDCTIHTRGLVVHIYRLARTRCNKAKM